MNLSEHIANENLNQLIDTWKNLTPYQRKVIYIRTHFMMIKVYLYEIYVGFPAWINEICTNSYPAHWL